VNTTNPIPMKEVDRWSATRLQELIASQAAESLTLEFKASGALEKTDSKRREITKDISALANSAGGIIIYGLVEDRKTHVALRLDDGANPEDIPPEWIEQVANAGIHPRVEGLRVDAIPIGDPTVGAMAYVVVVPESLTAHMAQDNRYYKRRGREVLPMEDYEVRDTMARASVPQLIVEVEAAPVPDAHYARDIELYVSNDATTPAEWCVAQLIVPSDLDILNEGAASGREKTLSVSGHQVMALRFQYGGLNRIPIWQGLRVNVRPPNVAPVRVTASMAGCFPLGWRITAPRMGWRKGQTTITIF
jgi:hypothetical protein